jgi:hypothetical protein
MARYPRLDPEPRRAVRLSTKLTVPDAERVTELAERDGMTRSEYLRGVGGVVLRVLEREESGPLAASG